MGPECIQSIPRTKLGEGLMDEAVSTTLEQLLNNTQLFLSYYNNKQKWTALYPMASKLAEQYRVLYR